MYYFKFFKNYNEYKIFELNLDEQFTNNGFIKINAKYNYSYDDINKFSHIYKFYNNDQIFKEVILNHKDNFKDNKR